MVESKVVPGAQPDLDRPTKHSRKTLVRGMVAKTAAAAPSAAMEMRHQPQRPGASMVPPAPGVPQTTAASAAAQEPVHPVTLFGALAGALGASADQTASKSGDWAIQFAAPKSEAEAKVAMATREARARTESAVAAFAIPSAQDASDASSFWSLGKPPPSSASM